MVQSMLNKAHYERMLAKLQRLENTLNPYLFKKIESLPAKTFRCNKQYHSIHILRKLKAASNGAVTANTAG